MSEPLLEELCPVCDDGLTRAEGEAVRAAKFERAFWSRRMVYNCPVCGIDMRAALEAAYSYTPRATS